MKLLTYFNCSAGVAMVIFVMGLTLIFFPDHTPNAAPPCLIEQTIINILRVIAFPMVFLVEHCPIESEALIWIYFVAGFVLSAAIWALPIAGIIAESGALPYPILHYHFSSLSSFKLAIPAPFWHNITMKLIMSPLSATVFSFLAVTICLPTDGFAGTTKRVSMNSGGTQGNLSSYDAFISGDGRYIAFESQATNLVGGDKNGLTDIFVHDRVSGTTELVSLNSNGKQGNNSSLDPCISTDGRYVAFCSYATNLVDDDTYSGADIFVRDLLSNTTEIVSINSSGVHGTSVSSIPFISADGRYVAFESMATNLVSGDTNNFQDVFVRDRVWNTTERVSLRSNGAQGNSLSYYPSISADGHYVAFHSLATNLVSGDSNNASDIFVHDRQLRTTELVSKSSGGTQGNGSSYFSSISADSRYVAFESFSTNIVIGDTNGVRDVFVRDRLSNTTERVSRSSSGNQGNGASYYAFISADGRYIAFESMAGNLVSGDSNVVRDVFIHDRLSHTTERLSVHSKGTQGNALSQRTSISGNGRYVAFESDASNIVKNDTNGVSDILVHDRSGRKAGLDFDGDGTSDYGCYDAAGNLGQPAGSWYFMTSTDGFITKTFGYAGTVPVAGDFDGDWTDDYGCYDAAGSFGQPAGSWYFMASTEGFFTKTFGYTGTVPLSGDFDGDGIDDYGCYDAAGSFGQPPGSWYLMTSNDGFFTKKFGYDGTVPVAGDFDGDGIDDYGCYDATGRYGQPAGSWYFMTSKDGYLTTTFGYDGTVPVAGDFDGDGTDDYGCYDAVGRHGQPAGSWYFMTSTDGFLTKTFGYDGTVPVAGDFDGDSLCDYGCYDATGRYGQPAGSWYFMTGTDGFFTKTFGYAGTVPVGGTVQ